MSWIIKLPPERDPATAVEPKLNPGSSLGQRSVVSWSVLDLDGALYFVSEARQQPTNRIKEAEDTKEQHGGDKYLHPFRKEALVRNGDRPCCAFF